MESYERFADGGWEILSCNCQRNLWYEFTPEGKRDGEVKKSWTAFVVWEDTNALGMDCYCDRPKPSEGGKRLSKIMEPIAQEAPRGNIIEYLAASILWLAKHWEGSASPEAVLYERALACAQTVEKLWKGEL